MNEIAEDCKQTTENEKLGGKGLRYYISELMLFKTSSITSIAASTY